VIALHPSFLSCHKPAFRSLRRFFPKFVRQDWCHYLQVGDIILPTNGKLSRLALLTRYLAGAWLRGYAEAYYKELPESKNMKSISQFSVDFESHV
jgi:hypothetical protein